MKNIDWKCLLFDSLVGGIIVGIICELSECLIFNDELTFLSVLAEIITWIVSRFLVNLLFGRYKNGNEIK